MLVVVGGHSRNIGKTSVAAGIIAALPERRWTAMKITQHGHGVCSAAGEPCDCAVEPEHAFALSEETAGSGTDSGRYLAAGAVRSFWLRTAVGQLGNAMPAIRRILEESADAIFESNSILQFLRPDLYIVVMDQAVTDFKESARRHLDRADAVVAIEREGEPAWESVAPKLWMAKPRFVVQPPRYVTDELAGFVLAALSAPVR